MKLIFLSMIFLFGLNVFGQTVPSGSPTPSPTATPTNIDRNAPVMTTQGFIDDSNRAFTELVASRDALEKYKNERGRTEAERSAAEAEIKGLNALIEIFKQGYNQYGQMVIALQKIIEFQWTIIDRLKNMMNKPKNWFQKFLDNFMKAVEIAIGILIGRGLASYIRRNGPSLIRTVRTARLSYPPFPEAYG